MIPFPGSPFHLCSERIPAGGEMLCILLCGIDLLPVHINLTLELLAHDTGLCDPVPGFIYRPVEFFQFLLNRLIIRTILLRLLACCTEI